MRFSPRVLALLVVLVTFIPALAHDSAYKDSAYKNVGRAATPEEIRAMDIAISTTGEELPPGSGTAKVGAPIYAEKCAKCHGATGEDGQLGPRLVGGKGTLDTLHPVLTIGSYWPFATTLWDYINRAMPRMKEGSLKPDEVYSLTAFLLFRNDIIQESDVMDSKTLPKVQMPNRNGFVPPRLEDIGDVRKRNCKLGHCL
jgi:mono/diheme cytochrome c family protein